MKLFWISFVAVIAALPVFAEDTGLNPYVSFRTETYDIQLEYLQNVSDHQLTVMRDLEAKLSQQKWQTTAIAVMVLIMVGVGLYLSYLQFRQDIKKDSRPSFTLRIGSGSFELSSSVIGLIILVLSFWFFQAYIDKVYSVQVFDLPLVDMTTFGVNQ